jgi:hypothetical protein
MVVCAVSFVAFSRTNVLRSSTQPYAVLRMYCVVHQPCSVPLLRPCGLVWIAELDNLDIVPRNHHPGSKRSAAGPGVEHYRGQLFTLHYHSAPSPSRSPDLGSPPTMRVRPLAHQCSSPGIARLRSTLTLGPFKEIRGIRNLWSWPNGEWKFGSDSTSLAGGRRCRPEANPVLIQAGVQHARESRNPGKIPPLIVNPRGT